jgi:peptide/nickel transport system substrate-binding protein
VQFHDGTPFNAEAVKYNLDRIVDPATASELAINLLGSYSATEIIDDSTVVVQMESPFAPLIDGMAAGNLCMVSPTAAAKWGVEDFQDHFVGTGPFILKEWVRQDHISLERNPDYWGGAEFFGHSGPAYLDSIVFRFVPEAVVRSGALETGEIPMVQEISAIDVERLKAAPNMEIVLLPSSGTGVMLMFNVSKAPTDDIRVRQAIEYAVDQKALTDILYPGVAPPSYGVLSTVSVCYWPGAEGMYPYDPAKAELLLEEAGWVDTDGDGIRDKDGDRLHLDFPTHGGYPVYRDPAPIVQAQLKEVGIDVEITNLAAPAWLEAGRTGNLNIGIIDMAGSDPDDNLRTAFHSENSGGFAWNWHNNSELDSLIEQGQVTADPEERCSVYDQVQKIIMEDAMIKPLHMVVASWGVREEVKGVRFDAQKPSYFWAHDVYLEE